MYKTGPETFWEILGPFLPVAMQNFHITKRLPVGTEQTLLFKTPVIPYDYLKKLEWGIHQAVTTCGLSSLASFLKILSSKRVCCVFRDIRDKNAVNQGFWSKTAVFSLPATKVDCLLMFWLPSEYQKIQNYKD